MKRITYHLFVGSWLGFFVVAEFSQKLADFMDFKVAEFLGQIEEKNRMMKSISPGEFGSSFWANDNDVSRRVVTPKWW